MNTVHPPAASTKYMSSPINDTIWTELPTPLPPAWKRDPLVGKQGVSAPVSSRLLGVSALLYMPAFASLCKRQSPIIQQAIRLANI
jgi:hypothetical protein